MIGGGKEIVITLPSLWIFVFPMEVFTSRIITTLQDIFWLESYSMDTFERKYGPFFMGGNITPVRRDLTRDGQAHPVMWSVPYDGTDHYTMKVWI